MTLLALILTAILMHAQICVPQRVAPDEQAVDVVFAMPKTAYHNPAIAEQQVAWLHATRIRLRSISFQPANHGRISLAKEHAEKASKQLAVSASLLEASTDTLEVRPDLRVVQMLVMVTMLHSRRPCTSVETRCCEAC